MEIKKNTELLEKIKKRKQGKIAPLKTKEKSYFSKIRSAVKKKKKSEY